MANERIQKLIASTGALSRRAAEDAITQGRVKLNGKTVTELGTQADREHDELSLDGRVLDLKPKLVTIALHKPRLVMCTRDDPQGRTTVLDLLPRDLSHLRPVGRLDYESEGLIFLTNDGDFHQQVTHPSNGIKKVYAVTVQGRPALEKVQALTQVIDLEDGPGRFDTLQEYPLNAPTLTPESRYLVTVSEGRNRFIRRMFSAIGHGVTRLVRVQVGGFPLGDLREGQWIQLDSEKLARVLKTLQNTRN